MKILMINSVCGVKSTGRICTDLAKEAQRQGHEVKIAYSRETAPESAAPFAVKFGDPFEVALHGLKARTFDAMGFGSKSATKKLVSWIREYDPDIIHLHNIHGYYLHIGVLFDYLKSCGKKVIWTLHDCWPFTGHTPYCNSIGCNKWETGCCRCPQKAEYPKSLTDFSKRNWLEKKNIFTGVPNLMIVTPSAWLKGLVKRSFLQDYPIEVIRNGIDTSVFHPIASDFRSRIDSENKTIILGVASIWVKSKGLADFIQLSRRLDDRFRIVLVGLSEKQKQDLPDHILSVTVGNDPKELSRIYSAADLFVNPTYEDTYPTVNLEAICCGTPVITYDTGGSPESARVYGSVVRRGDVDALVDAILHFEKTTAPIVGEFDAERMMEAYMNLYTK